jgi:hypothetical protein
LILAWRKGIFGLCVSSLIIHQSNWERVMRQITVFAYLVFMLPGLLWAQPKGSIQERLKADEERIKVLESEVRELKAALAVVTQNGRMAASSVPVQMPPTEPAAVPVNLSQQTPQAVVPMPTMSGEPAGQVPVYGGASAAAKALNPDISVIGDFLGSVGRDPLHPAPAMQMHESEVGLQAIIDPYARADFFLSFGEEGVNLEEGFITFTALPGGLVAKAGKMRAAFGKVNTLHNHVLPWTDRPMVTENLVGGEDGINDAGISLSRILPAPKGVFLEGTAQLFRGDSENVFKSSRKGDVSLVGHLRGYRDLTESTNLDLGFSYAKGHNELGSRFHTQLYGMDATLRWKPLRRAIYHSFIGRTEFIWSHRDQVGNAQRTFGFYASADYQPARRWFVGGRYDRSGRANDASLIDSGFSTVLTYWPSEFSQIRGQYRFARYADGRDGNELRL